MIHGERFPRGNCTRNLVAAIFLLILLVSVFSSCSREGKDAFFSEKLQTIDQLVARGQSKKALSSLAKLRSHATGSTNWLSIAARERRIGDKNAAVKTLEKALERMPANDALAAVLVETLLQQGKNTEALRWSSLLLNSPYRSVAALAELRSSVIPGVPSGPPAWWKIAGEETGDSAFYRNAVLLYALEGNLSKAVSVYPDDFGYSASDRQLAALIAYDSGFFALVTALLETSTPTADTLALLADTARQQDECDSAIGYWNALAAEYPDYSPNVWYNLALSATDMEADVYFLEECLHRFPAYYPAIARLVRKAIPAASEVSSNDYLTNGVNPVTAELDERNFLRGPDIRSRQNLYVTHEQAIHALDAGIGASDERDRRIVLERIRFVNSLKFDGKRAFGELWNLIEKYPEDQLVSRYAVWFFIVTGNRDAGFSLNRGGGSVPLDPFYIGLELACAGDLEGAEQAFSACASDPLNAWAAIANTARIRERQAKIAEAIDLYALATGLASDPHDSSRLQFETARLFVANRMPSEAIRTLGYAVQLDPENFRARALSKELEAGR